MTQTLINAPSRRVSGGRRYPSKELAARLAELKLSRNDAIAIAIFVADFAFYIFLVFVALAPLGLAVNIVGSIAAGMIIGSIFVLGHDACHDALTSYPRLNLLLGRIAFMPSAHNVSLWFLAHNQIHHGFTNLKGRDYVWAPMSPAEFAAASAARRAFYRFCRGPFGGLPYYLIEMWWEKVFLPIAPEARRHWRHHLFDSAFVVLSQIAIVAAVIAAGHWLDPARPVAMTLFLGWLLPFLVWNWFMGIIIYVQHTHPAVPWYNDRTKWKAAQVKVFGAVHVQLAQPLNALSNNALEHNVHHLDPSIPFYQLPMKQEQMRRVLDGIVVLKFGIRSYLSIVKECKLFDFERERWIRFDENPAALRTRRGD